MLPSTNPSGSLHCVPTVCARSHIDTEFLASDDQAIASDRQWKPTLWQP